MRDNVERWLTHESHSFEFVKNPDNLFHVLVKHAGEAGVPMWKYLSQKNNLDLCRDRFQSNNEK